MNPIKTKMAEPPSGNPAGVSCCNQTTNSSVKLLPPPPPPLAPSSQSHVAPFLIAAVCILGFSFLLLTTCTIILRRRRGGTPNAESPSPDDDISVVDHPIWHITTLGLQQSVIDSITAFKYTTLDHFLTQGSDCTVCLTEFEEGDDLRLLPKCSHAFHVTCIDTWLRSHRNCPLCRAPIVNEGYAGGNTPASGAESEGILGGESSSGDRAEDLGELAIEGIRIAEILNKNRELGVLSDLGVNYGFRREDVVDPMRRSFSLNAAICGTVGKGEEDRWCSSSGGNEERKVEVENGVSMSGLSMNKSSSIGLSSEKGTVCMKRSLSSGGKLFSFGRTKGLLPI